MVLAFISFLVVMVKYILGKETYVGKGFFQFLFQRDPAHSTKKPQKTKKTLHQARKEGMVADEEDWPVTLCPCSENRKLNRKFQATNPQNPATLTYFFQQGVTT